MRLIHRCAATAALAVAVSGLVAGAAMPGSSAVLADRNFDSYGTQVTGTSPDGTRVTGTSPNGTRVTGTSPDGTRVTAVDPPCPLAAAGPDCSPRSHEN